MRVLAENTTLLDNVTETTSEVVSSSRKRKIVGKGAGSKRKKMAAEKAIPNPLDRTWIHPESYNDTRK